MNKKQAPKKTPKATTPGARTEKRERTPKPIQAKVDRMKAAEEKRRGYRICGAWRPVKGGVCCKRPMKGKDRCKDCGGRSPRGISHPSTIHGIYSKDLPTRRRAQFDQTEQVEDLRQIAADLRILHLRLSDLHAGLSDAGTTELWHQLRKQAERFTHSDPDSDGGQRARRSALTRIFEIIEEGAAESERWDEIMRVQEHRRRLIQTDHRITGETDRIYTEEQVMLVISVLKELVETSVRDNKVIQRISDGIDGYLIAGTKGSA